MIDDICANNHGGDPCSVTANPSPSRKAIDRERVYDEAVKRGPTGAIAQELYNAVGLSENTGAARCSDLKAMRRLIRTSRRGITTSGKSATILVADIYAPVADQDDHVATLEDSTNVGGDNDADYQR